MPKSMPQDYAFGLVSSVVASLMLCLATASRTRHVRRDLVVCCSVCLALGMTYAIVFSTVPKLSGGVIAVLARGFAGGAGNGLLFCALLPRTSLLPEHIAGPLAGAVAASVGTSASYMVIFALTKNQPRGIGLPLCVGLALLGVARSSWRPLLLFPF